MFLSPITEELFELNTISSNNLIDFLSVLVDIESRNSANSLLRRNFLLLIDIDYQKFCTRSGVLIREAFVMWCDKFTWITPLSHEFYKDSSRRDNFIEFRSRAWFDNFN